MKISTTTIRWLVVTGLLGEVVTFFAIGWQRQFPLDALKAHQQALDAYRQAHPWLLGAGFFLVYVAFAALSLPADVSLTLVAGAVFGLLEGTSLVLFATSIGATLAILASRFVLRDKIQRHFGKHLDAINAGRAKEQLLLVHAAVGALDSVLRDQPVDGADAVTCPHLLLGQPSGHAGDDADVRTCRHPALQAALAVRHPVAADHWFAHEAGLGFPADALDCHAGEGTAGSMMAPMGLT
jgi:hypothetical protein